MERFLLYSLTRSRPIRLMLAVDGKLRQVTAVVTALEGDQVTLDIKRPKGGMTVAASDILAADYIKKDEGLN